MAYFLDQKNPYRRRRGFACTSAGGCGPTQGALPPVVVGDDVVNRPYRWEYPITQDWLGPVAYTSENLDSMIMNDRRFDSVIAPKLLGGWPRAADDLILPISDADAARLGPDFQQMMPALATAPGEKTVLKEKVSVTVRPIVVLSPLMKWILIGLALALVFALLMR